MVTQVPTFVAHKRARKADRIARALASRGVGADAAARLDPEARREIEVSAGIEHRGSERTWRSVVGMLAGSAMPAAACLTCGLGDPDGEPGPPKPHDHPGACSR